MRTPVMHAIRKLGFRRWYERQLYESHAYLVTAFLSLILMVSCIEVFEMRDSPLRMVTMLALAAGAGVLTLFAWKRFNRLLWGAEEIASNASCPACTVYGKFEVLETGTLGNADTNAFLKVRCRQCAHQWTIR